MTIRRVDAALAAAAMFAIVYANGCSSDSDAGPSEPLVVERDAGDGKVDSVRDAEDDAGGLADAGLDAPDGGDDRSDGAGEPVCERGFITEVVSIDLGERGGYRQADMPDVVYGYPRGGGAISGGLDVFAIGLGGEIVVGFDIDIADGPGPDFTVFENVVLAGGKEDAPFAEPGEVSVSMDGIDWTTFPCQPTAYPYTGCAGKSPVYSNLDKNEISPFDPAVSGGDSFDLADIGVTRARYVRIRDVGPDNSLGSQVAAGFDLDAIAVLNPVCR